MGCRHSDTLHDKIHGRTRRERRRSHRRQRQLPWDKYADKFTGLTTPDESYHGLTYTKAFGRNAYITKATAQLMRDLGSAQSPQNAFLLNLGLETPTCVCRATAPTPSP